MQASERSQFVNNAGNVILDSLHLPSFITGLVLSIPVFLALFFALKVQSQLLTSLSLLSSLPLSLYALSRLAMNGLSGDGLGGFFSKSGGGIEEVMPVFGRLVTLVIIWALPLITIGFYEPKLAQGMRFPFSPLEPPPLFLTLYAGTAVFVPVLLVIVAAAATRFTEIFSGALWSGLFKGRSGEVLLILAATIGAPVALLVIVAPWLSALASKSMGFAGFLGGLFLIYLVGAATCIQGKLCGFFAAAVMQEDSDAPAAARPQPAPAGESSPLTAETAPETAGQPVLPAADEEVRKAWGTFEINPRAAATRLESLAAEFAPHPRVLHGLAMMLFRMGDTEKSIEAAKTAIPLCLSKQQGLLASELFRAFAGHIQRLDLDHTQLAALGDVILNQGDPLTAANVYAFSLAADVSDLKAFKGLLKIADQYLQKGESLDRAVKIYEYLLQKVPASQFSDHVRAQLELAKRKLART